MLSGKALARAARAALGSDISSAAISETSVDVTLGSSFWIPKPTTDDHAFINLSDIPSEREMYDTVTVTDGAFQLDPGKFVKARTSEVFTMPRGLSGIFTLRSCIAQSGLEQCTSVFIRPRWRGQLVLELYNFFNKPLLLEPGLRIGQVHFFEVGGWEC